jgi:two-component system response regulator EvgA
MFIQALLGQLPTRPRAEFVGDGEELLDRLGQGEPDLIVLDLDLPRVGGLEVLSVLQARRHAPPVVVFSSSQGQATIDACRRLGAARFVHKPSGFREFREAVTGIVAQVPILAA